MDVGIVTLCKSQPYWMKINFPYIVTRKRLWGLRIRDRQRGLHIWIVQIYRFAPSMNIRNIRRLMIPAAPNGRSVTFVRVGALFSLYEIKHTISSGSSYHRSLFIVHARSRDIQRVNSGKVSNEKQNPRHFFNLMKLWRASSYFNGTTLGLVFNKWRFGASNVLNA